MIGHLLKSRKIYDGKILSLRVDDVRLKQGIVARREVIEHPGAVAIVAFKDPRTVVMVRQLRHTVNGWLLEIPAGTLKKNENPVCCAQRELAEETGYEAGKMMRMFSCYVAPGYSNELIHEFVATDLKHVGQCMDPDEFIQTTTVKIGDVASKIEHGKIRDGKSICGLLYVSSRYQTIHKWLMKTKKNGRPVQLKEITTNR